ncbi:uncharacterized protein BXIN_2086 [Babesia sp. Xinjiang]|uniref:uncharacterized protein n=1 Tax=Babesia sp. Xinjiang TaxID=462227 RepID=UPI000A22CCCB|nr:uncharacterized protein BXIN_2086 [Babesia sp. Xinjiang]ORM40411.1 hypothetical protein BXIN_2086 [Babesia sp. Xinjiang]
MDDYDGETDNMSRNNGITKVDVAINVGNTSDNELALLVRYSPMCNSLENNMTMKASRLPQICTFLESLKEKHQYYMEKRAGLETRTRQQYLILKNSVESLKIEISALRVLTSEMDVTIPDLREDTERVENGIQCILLEKDRLGIALKKHHTGVNAGMQQLKRNYWASNLRIVHNLLAMETSTKEGDLLLTFRYSPQPNCCQGAFITLRTINHRIEGISCLPMVENFYKHVDELNNGLSLGLFICHIRKYLKELF